MQGVSKGELQFDLDCWQLMRFPTSMLCAVCACQNGVKRAHLVRSPPACGLLITNTMLGCLVFRLLWCALITAISCCPMAEQGLSVNLCT